MFRGFLRWLFGEKPIAELESLRRMQGSHDSALAAMKVERDLYRTAYFDLLRYQKRG